VGLQGARLGVQRRSRRARERDVWRCFIRRSWKATRGATCVCAAGAAALGQRVRERQVDGGDGYGARGQRGTRGN
jgi:hypothetical protein